MGELESERARECESARVSQKRVSALSLSYAKQAREPKRACGLVAEQVGRWVYGRLDRWVTE